MEFESFFGALTMERKAPFALSEGKLLSNSAHPLPGPVESLADCSEDFFFLSGGFEGQN